MMNHQAAANIDPYVCKNLTRLHYQFYVSMHYSLNQQLPQIIMHEVLGLFDPIGRPQSRPVVITIFTQSVRPSVRLKTSKSSDNHCMPGLWAGRVDH